MVPSDSNMEMFQHTDGHIKFIQTPWDSIILGCDTISITEISSPLLQYSLLLRDFLEFCNHKKIGFISIRIVATNNHLKSELQILDFRIVEHTLDIHSASLDLNKIKNLTKKLPIQTTTDILGHVVEVKKIAEKAFKFGRFLEDPLIENELGLLRNSNWIDDLIQKEAHFNILLKKGSAVGFLSWDKNAEGCATLLFGGVLENYQHLAYVFWANTLQTLLPITSITTTISSSNTPISNLYSYFGFTFENPMFGLHKHFK